MNHLKEWEASCVDDQLIHLNVTALDGDRPSNYLLYSDALPRRNDGRVMQHILKRYQHTEWGGWWCSGIDLLTGEDDLWGCFKPSQPRCSIEGGKLIKYEHPPKTPTGLFALRVPLHLWQRIARRYNLAIEPEDIHPEQSDFGFWQWLLDHPTVPLCITEGAKKAGALLSAGYAAIALPGINGGYRIPRDENGNRLGKSHLIPQLLKLATPGRTIYIVFDQDTKPSTINAVNTAIRRTGYLLSEAGCTVNVITWTPQMGKGVDDIIALHGESAFDCAYQNALPLDTWKAQALTRLTYPASLQLNCRYLPHLSIPDTAKLIGIKSPKGTGKTQLLETIVAQALKRGQWVLVIGHRIQLVEALCQRFGLNYITEIRDDLKDTRCGYGLCIDSLHPTSQAHFQAVNWSNGLVIIDEVEQVLWHGLNSPTCQTNRVAILKSLKTLMQNVLGGKGQVFVTDADLSDVSLDYLIALAGVGVQPFIIENDWKPGTDEAWQVYSYTETTPNRLVRDLVKHIASGGKPFVCLSAQKPKSQWGTCNLEAYLKQKFPSAKILRIDSESLTEPDHPACGCISQLEEVLGDYDIVLASPSIETGVSIELRGHFTSVWAIAQGIQAENSVRQALGRIREHLPRYVWIAPYGFNQVGNGATSIPKLISCGHRLTQLNIRLLQQSDFERLDDLDIGFQAESLSCWAKMAVRCNASMIHYRESVLAALRHEGHRIIEVPYTKAAIADPSGHPTLNPIPQTDGDKASSREQTNSLMTAITAVRDQNYQAECDAVASSEDLTDTKYYALKRRLVKTTAQRRTLRKYELRQRYGLAVTPQLVAKDDEGWYQKLRLHYFLTVGRQHLEHRDAAVARHLIEQGEGSLFIPDFNRSQLGVLVGTMDILGIPVLLEHPQRELRNSDDDLKAMAAIALTNRTSIKMAVGIGLAKNSTPITIIRRFLDKIGYGLRCVRTESQGKKRVRVYQLLNPDSEQSEIFKYWLGCDGQLFTPSENGTHRVGEHTAISSDITNAQWVQLSLNFS